MVRCVVSVLTDVVLMSVLCVIVTCVSSSLSLDGLKSFLRVSL